MERRDAPGAGLELDVHRSGSGEQLVLIHGIGHTWRGWKPMLPRLQEHFEVLAPDLPGYGHSPPLPDGVRPWPEELADAVEAVMDEAGFERPLVVGNSLGGWIALILARRGRARAAVGISPAGLWLPREAAWGAGVLRFMRAAAALGPLPDAVVGNPIGRTLFAGPGAGRPWRLDPDDMREQAALFASAPSFDATLEGIGQQVAGLPEIEVPVLLLWGTRDLILLPRQGRRFERLIPDAELRYLKGLGHVPMSDDPNLLVEEILGFANEPRRSRPASAPA